MNGAVFPPPRAALFCLLLLTQVFMPQQADAFVLNGHRWADGSHVVMNLYLTRPPVAFQDGSASWAASAADALSLWNQQLNLIDLAAGNSTVAIQGDGVSSAFFDYTVYGETFGPNVLAVTLYFPATGGPSFTEADVIFNAFKTWDSYRGPLQDSGATPVFDFHRVALHEFGHALGLSHAPGNVIMNAIIGDLDHLAQDDIDGVRALYSRQITSPQTPQNLNSGETFSYQITADNNPTSYAATGLPPGLHINSATGLISGICRTSGDFVISIVVQGTQGIATGMVMVHVQPLPLTSPHSAEVLVGDTFSYQIAAANSPTSFTAQDLPAWLTLNPSTGVVSGRAPAIEGSFSITVKARGAASEAAGNVDIFVSGPRITSQTFTTNEIGSPLNFQITANNHPTSFTALGLPAGLHLNATTGAITGIPTLSGSYDVTVTASSSRGNATIHLFIYITAAADYTPPEAIISDQYFPTVLADPARHRLYVGTNERLDVLDAGSFALLKHLSSGASFFHMTMSASGRELYFTKGFNRIGRLDLETLEELPDVPTNGISAGEIKEGADGVLYVTSLLGSNIYQIDPATGEILSTVHPPASAQSPYWAIEISPDRKSLFAFERAENSSVLVKYRLTAGSAPVLEKQITAAGPHSSGEGLAVSTDGAFVVATFETSPVSDPTIFRSSVDLTPTPNSIPSDAVVRKVFFSPDGLFLVRAYQADNRVDIFELTTRRLVERLTLPEPSNDVQVVSMTVDPITSRLYIGTASNIYVYPINPLPPHRSLLNVSTRLRAGTGDDVPIGGFIISGTEPKKILVRAIGPSLPVEGKLPDPSLELHNSAGAIVSSNDNWNSLRLNVLATGAPPADEHESAIVTTLQPGAYTAVLHGRANTTGVALVELYDLEPNNSRIANISTRGKVETGDNVMIGGFIISNGAPTKVIVRAIGPSLAGHGVAGALADTTLSLYDENGAAVATNDDWQTTQRTEIVASTVPPSDPRESALVRTLQPGAYTAIVRGKNNATGVALVEVYNLETD